MHSSQGVIGMRNFRVIRIALFLLALTTLAAAQTSDWRTNRQARTVINRLITSTSNFQREIDRNRYPWDTSSNQDERLSGMVSAFSTELSELRTSLGTTNGDPMNELDGVLRRASRISMFINRNRLNTRAQSHWTAIRSDVTTLARYYNIAWNGNEPYNGNGSGYGNNGSSGNYGNRRDLTGTFRLNMSMSDNVTAILDRSVGSYAKDQRDRMRNGLERRLRSPEMIAIDKNGRTITMSSSLQPQVTFDADGIARTETNPRGRTITTTVTQANRGFTVNYSGDRMSDFDVTFDVDRDGRLRVTRRIYLENRNDTVTAVSIYDRVNDRADWSAVVQEPRDRWNGNTASSNEFYVPNGVVLTAQLRNTVNTKASQIGDRFSLQVTNPNEFRGAIIDGHIGEAANSGRVTGRAQLQLDLDTITVNGRQYAFAGIIQSVNAVNGDSVTVNNEGTIRDNSQTNKTVTRAGIGAALGAIIGAIAGGGSGAAIGAGVGAGAGAGSVLLGGRDSIELGTGSTFTISASAPANTSYNRR